MRTTEEIIKRLDEIKESKLDFFGFESIDLLTVLPYDKAKPYLKEDTKPEDWKPDACDDEAVKKRIVEYLDFAWEKAHDHRGLSASRSISHFSAWCWLLGDDEAFAFVTDEKNYPPYGAPVLEFLSKRFGHKRPVGEINDNMARGEACSPGCRSCMS